MCLKWNDITNLGKSDVYNNKFYFVNKKFELEYTGLVVLVCLTTSSTHERFPTSIITPTYDVEVSYTTIFDHL